MQTMIAAFIASRKWSKILSVLMIIIFAITILSELDYNCMITPPEIFLGKGKILVPKKNLAIVIDFISGFGDFSINLSITKVGSKKIKICTS